MEIKWLESLRHLWGGEGEDCQSAIRKVMSQMSYAHLTDSRGRACVTKSFLQTEEALADSPSIINPPPRVVLLCLTLGFFA